MAGAWHYQDPGAADAHRGASATASETDWLRQELRRLSERAVQDQQRMAAELASMAERLRVYDEERRESASTLEQLQRQLDAHRRAAEDSARARAVGEQEAARLRDELGRAVQERDRIDQQAEVFQRTAQRSLSDLEQELERQVGVVAVKEQEVAVREQQMREAKQEVAAMREHLERAAKELISRDRDAAAAAQRSTAVREEEGHRLKAELAALEEGDRQRRGELSAMQQRCEEAQQHNQELVRELVALSHRVKLAESEADTLRDELTDMTAQRDAAAGCARDEGVARGSAEREARRLSEVCTDLDQQLRRCRDELEDRVRELGKCQGERAAFAARTVRAAEAAGEELRRLCDEADCCRSALRERIIAGLPPPQRQAEEELRVSDERERASRRLRAAGVAGEAQRQGGDEQAVSALLARQRDDLTAAWEDLRVIRADVSDEMARSAELARQHRALQEAYVVERDHLGSLTRSLEQANASCAKLAEEKRALEESHMRNDQWMHEAVGISRQRDAHRDAMLGELDELRQQIAQRDRAREAMLSEMEGLRLQLSQRDRACDELRARVAEHQIHLEQVSVEHERSTRELAMLRGELSRCEEELRYNQATGLRDRSAAAEAVSGELRAERRQRADAEAALERLTREHEQLRQREERLQHDLAQRDTRARAAEGSWSGELDSCRERLRQAEAESARYAVECAALRDEKAEMERVSEAVQGRMQELQQEQRRYLEQQSALMEHMRAAQAAAGSGSPWRIGRDQGQHRSDATAAPQPGPERWPSEPQQDSENPPSSGRRASQGARLREIEARVSGLLQDQMSSLAAHMAAPVAAPR
eukprot:TRINITY_DN4150_c0_g1_i1.p1 TRINITY_DN4150_c0_g1~~TRINITY_DN4150_c0_g1_i1.p1  ORF type:complete len:859 (+),score=348.46 TRINITY_DN4150_c0_g1_i1:94-2577(+)